MDPEKKLLIIDPNTEDAAQIAAVLKKNGYITQVENSIQSDLENFFDSPPAMVFIDPLTTGSINGIEFCRKIKNSNAGRHIPILLISPILPGLPQLVNDCNADGFLAKPISVNELLEVVEKWIDAIDSKNIDQKPREKIKHLHDSKEAAKIISLTKDGEHIYPAKLIATIFSADLTCAITYSDRYRNKFKIIFKQGNPVDVKRTHLVKELLDVGIISREQASQAKLNPEKSGSFIQALHQIPGINIARLEQILKQLKLESLKVFIQQSPGKFVLEQISVDEDLEPLVSAPEIVLDAVFKYINEKSINDLFESNEHKFKPIYPGLKYFSVQPISKDIDVAEVLSRAKNNEPIQRKGRADPASGVFKAAYALLWLKAITFNAEEAISLKEEMESKPQEQPETERISSVPPADSQETSLPSSVEDNILQEEATPSPEIAVLSTQQNIPIPKTDEPAAKAQISVKQENLANHILTPFAEPFKESEAEKKTTSYDDAVALLDMSAEDLVEVGRKLMEKGTFNKATDYLRLACIKSEKPPLDYLMDLAAVISRNRIFTRRQRLFYVNDVVKRALSFYPNSPSPWIMLGSLLLDLDENIAAEMFKNSLENDPNSSEAKQQLEKLRRRKARSLK